MHGTNVKKKCNAKPAVYAIFTGPCVTGTLFISTKGRKYTL